MNATYRAWQAGFVRRWHTNFDLCHTIDCDAGHQGRVAVLVLGLFPQASRALIVNALTHDQGEIAVGDVSYMVKAQSPAMRPILEGLERDEIARQGLPQCELSPDEAKALKMCDWLDAWLWMARHRPELASRADWMAQLEATMKTAEALGVEEKVAALVGAVVEAIMQEAKG